MQDGKEHALKLWSAQQLYWKVSLVSIRGRTRLLELAMCVRGHAVSTTVLEAERSIHVRSALVCRHANDSILLILTQAVAILRNKPPGQDAESYTRELCRMHEAGRGTLSQTVCMLSSCIRYVSMRFPFMQEPAKLLFAYARTCTHVRRHVVGASARYTRRHVCCEHSQPRARFHTTDPTRAHVQVKSLEEQLLTARQQQVRERLHITVRSSFMALYVSARESAMVHTRGV